MSRSDIFSSEVFDLHIWSLYHNLLQEGGRAEAVQIQTGPELAIFILQQKNNYTKSCQQLHDLCNYLKTEFWWADKIHVSQISTHGIMPTKAGCFLNSDILFL